MDKRKKIKIFIAAAVSLWVVFVFMFAKSGLPDLCRFHFFACGSSANLNAVADRIGGGAPSENQNSTFFQTVTVEPNKIKVGETQTTRVEIASVVGVEKVSAQIPFEGSYDEIALRLVSGNERQGVWEGQWVAHNTLAKEYKTKIIAADRDGKVVETEASWWDDTETAWYDQNWSNRKKATIANSAGALTNYQVKLTVPYQSQMQPDFDDIRFTSADGKTPLDFWLESKTDSTTADFWVEAASLSASANTNIYYYYGNASVSTISSDTNTFVRVISNLVGGWDMNEGSGTTAHDKSGNGNDGTISGATFTTDRNGNANQALSFDGADDYVEVSHNSVLEPASVSVSAWVKLNNDGSRHIVAAKWTGYSLEVSSTGSPYFLIWNSQGSASITSSVPIQFNTWQHLVGTFDDSTKEITISVNGNETGRASLESSIIYEHSILRISNTLYGGSDGAVNGLIDDTCIYNRALTADEIADVYSASHTTLIVPSKVLVRNYVSGEPTVSIATQEENAPNRPGAVGTSAGPMMF
ncbi:MAG: DUF2341 domain-containing protein [Patescibacteria group bacterium]